MKFDLQFLKSFPQVKLAYLFGSQVSGEANKNSDYDFAFYIDEKNANIRNNIKLDLIIGLSKMLKTDDIDVVTLNDSDSPELNYNVIKYGKLLYEVEPFKVIVEPKILETYFDFISMLRRNNLTKA